MSKVGYLVKEARTDSKLTQIEAVDKLKSLGVVVTQSKLSRIENGEYKMPSEWIVKFAKAYNVHPLRLSLTKSEIDALGYTVD